MSFSNFNMYVFILLVITISNFQKIYHYFVLETNRSFHYNLLILIWKKGLKSTSVLSWEPSSWELLPTDGQKDGPTVGPLVGRHTLFKNLKKTPLRRAMHGFRSHRFLFPFLPCFSSPCVLERAARRATVCHPSKAASVAVLACLAWLATSGSLPTRGVYGVHKAHSSET